MSASETVSSAAAAAVDDDDEDYNDDDGHGKSTNKPVKKAVILYSVD